MQLNMFGEVGVSANREVAPTVHDIADNHFYYINGVLGMKNDGMFTDEKRHWMTFTRETVIPMQERNELPRGATQRGVFIATESGARLKIAKPVTPQVPGGDMEKYIKVAADSIDQLRKVDVYRVLVESNRVEFRQAIASYIKSKRPDLVEEVDEVLMEAGVGAAGQNVETRAPAKAVGLDESKASLGGEDNGVIVSELDYDQLAHDAIRLMFALSNPSGLTGDELVRLAKAVVKQARLSDDPSILRATDEFGKLTYADVKLALVKTKSGPVNAVLDSMATLLSQINVAAGDVADKTRYVKLDEVRAEYPFGKASREDQFFGSKIRVLSTGMTGDADWAGTVQSTLNGGRLFSVKRDGTDFSVRIGGDRIDVLERVEYGVGVKEVAVLPDTAGKAVPAEQNVRLAFEHAGYQIYPLTRSDGREVWLLQSQDNKVAGKLGFGDAIYDAVEQAQKNAELQSRNATWKAEIAAKVDAEAALAEASRESNRGLSLSERKAKAVLEKDVSFGGKNMTLREVVEQLVASGAEVSSDEVDAIKPMSRMQFHRADQRQQDAHEKRVKEAGKKTLYYVGDYNLGKTAYDYACSLKVKDVPVAEVLNSISDPVTESIKRNNAREQQFNRDAQYQQLMLAKREDVQGIVDGMSVEDTQAALDRLNAAPGDNLPVRASLAVKLDRADKVAVEVLNSEVEQKDSTQVSKGEQVQLDSVCLLVKEFANKKLAMAAGELSNKNYTVRPCAEADVSKPWLLEVEWSRKSIASRYAEKLAEGRAGVSPEPSDYHYSFADHILNKDAYRLDHLANGLNDEGKRVFTAVTGVELPKQQGATWAAIREWGGISLEEDNKNKAWRQVVFERQKLEPKVGVDPLLWANDKVEKGFAQLKKVGRETWLVHADGQGFNLSKKGTNQTMLVPYLEAKIKYEQARAACEPSVAAVEGCVSEGTFSGAVLSVANGVAVQKVSRDGATANHDLSKLSGKVAVGDVLDIKYQGGVGVVGSKALTGEVTR